MVVGEGRAAIRSTRLAKGDGTLVMQGAKLIGANSERVRPHRNGIAPACRALIAPIEMATGKQAYFSRQAEPADDANVD